MIEHRMDIRLKQEDFDDKGNIRAGALLYFFQEAAAEHADLLGVGFEHMIEKGRIWIITKLRFRILTAMEPGGNYYVMTYPRQKKSRICPRDYYICDQEGKLLVKGTTLWSIMDYKTRKLERIDFEYEGELYEEEAFEDGFPKLHMKNPEEAGVYTVKEEDLDVNDHTNNCRYADLVRGVSQTEEIKEFSIQFSKETRLGDKIRLSREAVPGGELICGSRVRSEADGEEGGDTVFLAKVLGC